MEGSFPAPVFGVDLENHHLRFSLTFSIYTYLWSAIERGRHVAMHFHVWSNPSFLHWQLLTQLFADDMFGIPKGFIDAVKGQICPC